MKKKTLWIVSLLLLVSLVGCGGGAPDEDWTLQVTGAVGAPLSVSYQDLADMPQTELSDILMERSEGEDTTGSWSGVALSHLMEQAGAPADYASITAVASDGYAIEIPIEELEGAIVALKQDGEWIANTDPDHGPIRLVCPHTPANRWVFQLVEVQVNTAAAAGSGSPEDAALKITGAVENEIGWTEEKIRSMDTIEAESTNKAGETSTYTGVLISDLLGKAQPNADASTLVFVADDGYTAEAPLADIQACADCIVSFRNQGGFSIVAPGFEGSVQVKGVVEIRVQ
ncbi:MAG: molybdopterin-dependent oxidoreductase [Anaerolineae bacterium]